MSKHSLSIFATSLKKLREQCSLTQPQLAQLISSTRETIGSWEQGVSTPNPEMIVRLKNALNCSFDELLEGKV